MEEEKFWKTTLSTHNSTFGTGEKGWKDKDPTLRLNQLTERRPFSGSGKQVGRIRFANTMDFIVNESKSRTNSSNCSCSQWKNPKKFSMSFRQPERPPPDNPGPNKYKLGSTFDLKPPYCETLSKLGGREDGAIWGQHLGPGTYEVEIVGSKYERCIDPILKPKESVRPRTTMSTTNLDIIDHYQVDVYNEVDPTKSPGPAYYDVSTDPRRMIPSKTFGMRTTVPTETFNPGPGDYLIERASPFEGPHLIARPSPIISRLKPLINPSADPDDMTSLKNKAVWSRYKSPYTFPKKIIPRLKKGQVFYSTVQDMPQYHAGKHSSGAYIKT